MDEVPVEDLCGREEGDASAVLGLHLGALFGVLIVAAIGVGLPFFLNLPKWKVPLYIGKVFGAGVVLGTAFAHILNDAIGALSNPCLGLSAEYPWALVFCGGAILILFLLEHFLHQHLDRSMGVDSCGKPEHGSVESGRVLVNNSSGEVDIDRTKELSKAHNNVVAIILESGMVIHSIFIGISMGITNDASVLRPLFIAILFHQGFEGVALGTVFIKAGYSARKFFLYALAFILVTPLGVGIGMASSYNENGKRELAVEGAFNSISAGILLYNGLVNLVLPAFSASELPKKSVWQFAGVVSMFAGYSLMSMLAKWA